MSQNGQTHFKNLAANAARFLKCLTILTLCIKGLKWNLPKQVRQNVVKTSLYAFITNFMQKVII